MVTKSPFLKTNTPKGEERKSKSLLVEQVTHVKRPHAHKWHRKAYTKHGTRGLQDVFSTFRSFHAPLPTHTGIPHISRFHEELRTNIVVVLVTQNDRKRKRCRERSTAISSQHISLLPSSFYLSIFLFSVTLRLAPRTKVTNIHAMDITGVYLKSFKHDKLRKKRST